MRRIYYPQPLTHDRQLPRLSVVAIKTTPADLSFIVLCFLPANAEFTAATRRCSRSNVDSFHFPRTAIHHAVIVPPPRGPTPRLIGVGPGPRSDPAIVVEPEVVASRRFTAN